MTTWVKWKAENGKETVWHAVDTLNPGDVTAGCFPVACGRYVPDGWEAGIKFTQHADRIIGSRCKSCAKHLRKES